MLAYSFVTSRKGSRLGHDSLVDGMLKDGLWDVYNDVGMGSCAEICADNHSITREEQVLHCFNLFLVVTFGCYFPPPDKMFRISIKSFTIDKSKYNCIKAIDIIVNLLKTICSFKPKLNLP